MISTAAAIDIISSVGLARAFLTRALLSSKSDITEVEEILKNRGFGTADAFHINVGLLHDNVSEQRFYSIEVTPSKTALESNVVIESIMPNTTSFHVNRCDYTTHGWSVRDEYFSRIIKNRIHNIILYWAFESNLWQKVGVWEKNYVLCTHRSIRRQKNSRLWKCVLLKHKNRLNYQNIQIAYQIWSVFT